ncbi:hypothetical protein EDD18DRAFT_1105477 [Armillaria luteobubalina]|uniref:Uncharacterized protein n=1 Tax=Armillaria luteobubalina TaxID=153913 RepID=A0AA39Q4Y0_9AGAR|nr:hypothetical protein EDD18DRAFT_1105477 [Armillaria luteobubalina]
MAIGLLNCSSLAPMKSASDKGARKAWGGSSGNFRWRRVSVVYDHSQNHGTLTDFSATSSREVWLGKLYRHNRSDCQCLRRTPDYPVNLVGNISRMYHRFSNVLGAFCFLADSHIKRMFKSSYRTSQHETLLLQDDSRYHVVAPGVDFILHFRVVGLQIILRQGCQLQGSNGVRSFPLPVVYLTSSCGFERTLQMRKNSALNSVIRDQELLVKQGEVRKHKLYRKIRQAEQMANVARLGLTASEEEAMIMKEKLDKVLPDLIVETNLTPSSQNFSAIAPEITCPICYGTMRSVVQATVTSPPRPDDRVQNIAKAFPDPEPQYDSCDAEIGYEGIESWKKMFSADVGSL